MVYQDHLTKFVTLRALRSKTAIEVASQVKSIFSTYGAPKILQTDNGREFKNATLKELIEQWPACKFVHGKPRHSQSQGSVERCNQDVENILFCMMRDKQTTQWASLLEDVQYAKNTRYHSGIGRTPFKAMFGKLFFVIDF
jgi:transposase InsO family protein